MKRKLTYLLLLALMLLPAACEEKEMPDYEYTANDITVLVPGGWQAAYQEAQRQITIQAPKEEYALGIQILESGDITSEEVARAMSEQLNGETPEPAARYTEYAFNCSIMELPALVNILSKDGYTLVLIEVGDNGKFAEQTDAIMKSMKSSNPAYQNVIEAIKF